MPSPKSHPASENPLISQAETVRFLRDHLPLKRIMAVTRERFAQINDLLLQEQINRHDRSHQLRTAVNATKAMRLLGFEHREIMQAATGALVHDIGYNRPDAPNPVQPLDDYHGGNRAKFKKHALYGALETEDKLTRILALVRQHGEKTQKLRELISYKDENGQIRQMDEQDIERIVEAILNHNDYGKDENGYNPRHVGRGALMVQMFDKLDICRQRIYPQHMHPAAFLKGSAEFDPKYFHRTASYCVSNYDFTIDPEDGILRMKYQVDLEPFRRMMRKIEPDFKYEPQDFARDLSRAYDKNFRIAAEAMGMITDRPTSQQALLVELRFADGEKMEFAFSRPDRKMYEEKMESLRVRMAEILKLKQPEALPPTEE